MLLKKIRRMLLFFIVAPAISGITAFPVETELKWLLQYTHLMPNRLANFLHTIYNAITQTNQQYPYIAYGSDWLAFAHLVIATAFIGPLKDPVKNIWIIEWAMIACVAIIPLAFICGTIRQIPFYWRLIDCSFGLFGIIPLYLCRKWIKELEIKIKKGVPK
jgi:hypothetical protein